MEEHTIIYRIHAPDMMQERSITKERIIMKCIICKVGETALQNTTVTFQRHNTSIIIKNVPAEVCTNCGEQYVDSATGERLSLIADEALKDAVKVNGEAVTVQHYQAA